MRILLLLCSIGWAGLAASQEAAPSPAERQARRDKASSLRAQASELRSAADKQLAADMKACWKKFRVTACMDDAKTAKQDTLDQAREREKEARDIERELRRIEAEEREKRFTDEVPRREAEGAARAERNRLEQQEAMERVEKKRLEDEQRDKR